MSMIAWTERFSPTFVPEKTKSLRIHFNFEDERRKMTADEFWDFCAQNRKLRAELTKNGDVIVMPPTGFETGKKNSAINFHLTAWARKDKSGEVTDSNSAYILENGAVYAPDAAWTRKERLEKFSAEELKKFLPICPDFVIELRSESDTLKDLQAKMAEYIENGARLGWLIDPMKKQLHVYRPDSEAEILDQPRSVSGEDVLAGFVLDLTEIW